MMEEVWKPIQSSYNSEVSNLGRVRYLGNDGHYVYPEIAYNASVRKNKCFVKSSAEYARYEMRAIYVENAVANAFIPNPNNCSKVGFKNGDVRDLRVENLYWKDGTHPEFKKPKKVEELEEYICHQLIRFGNTVISRKDVKKNGVKWFLDEIKKECGLDCVYRYSKETDTHVIEVKGR